MNAHTPQTDQETRLREVFDCTLAALVELAEDHRNAAEGDEFGDVDSDTLEAARTAIHHDPLSIQVRDGWRDIGGQSEGAEEFEILLSTGGPAARIRGTLDEHMEPETFHIEVQDWFTPWTGFTFSGAKGDLIRQWYLSEFYFGEG